MVRRIAHRSAWAAAIVSAVAGVPAMAAPAAAAPFETVVVTMRPAPGRPTPAPGQLGAAGVAGLLRARSDTDQRGIRSALGAQRRRGRVRAWTPLWIANAVVVTATPDLIAELGRRPDVASVTTNAVSIAPAAVEPGIALSAAPTAWGQGATGAGVVVASLDTGVDATHPTLTGTFRGGPNGWFDPYGEHPGAPFDATGHGTATTGVMVGAGGIGMAPDVRWIAARVFDDLGNATEAAIHLAFQWAIDPDGDPTTDDAPDIVLNSWNGTVAGCDTRFQPDLQALIAAGIVPVFAAGNEGPGPATNASPANLPEAIAVGAVEQSGTLTASFSSRGPSGCGGGVYPSLVAPGVDVRSSALGGGYAVTSGTSLAAPHVAGALALALSVAPGLSVARQRALLATTAVDIAGPGVDNDSGAGRLDAAALVETARQAPPAPVADTRPPAASAASLPGVVTGRVDVPITATITDDASPIDAAEAFVDTVGAPGDGIALPAADGAFDTSHEAVSGLLRSAAVGTLPAGRHVILVRGRDSAGNWGPPARADFVVERDGPVITGGPAGAIRVTREDTVTVTLRATDPDNGMEPGSVVGGITGSALAAALPGDGAFDGPAEPVEVTLDTTSLAATDTVTVRAHDIHGNIGPERSFAIVVRPAATLLRDNFESGTVRKWTGHGGRVRVIGRPGRRALTASAAARMGGFVTSDSPDGESAYAASFTVDARATLTGARDIFVGTDAAGVAVFRVQLKAGRRRPVMIRAVDVAGEPSRWLRLPRGAGRVAVVWRSGSDGSLDLRVGAAQIAHIAAPGAARLERVRLGTAGRTTSRDRGTIRFDSFASRRPHVGVRHAL